MLKIWPLISQWHLPFDLRPPGGLYIMFRISQGSYLHATCWAITWTIWLKVWPMTSVSFSTCLRMSQESFHVNLSSIGGFSKIVTFEPLNDHCYDLHFIFNMFRMSQGSFHLNLSSIGAAFLKNLTLLPLKWS